MPPHTNNPHYQSQQPPQQQPQQPHQPQQQQQQQQQAQSQQQQHPSHHSQQQGSAGNQPSNGHNVAGGTNRGSSEQQAVVAQPSHQHMYPPQAIPANYMTGTQPSNQMYPVQVIPQPVPGNVYVSNLTANVNVHGFMPHGMPPYMAAAGTPPGPSGAFIASEGSTGHEMQAMVSRGGQIRRNGRNRIGSTPRPRGGYVPQHIVQQTMIPPNQPNVIHQPQQPNQQGQAQVQQQTTQQPQQPQAQAQSQNPQQSQQHHPPQQQTPEIVQHPMAMEHQQMMSPAQPYGYSGAYYLPVQIYHPTHVGHHPTAQHATGAPIFQVPMYPSMYGYAPGVMYPTMYPPEYPIYDDKGDEHNPQQPPEEGVMHAGMWQPPTMLEYNPESGEYIPHEDDGSMLQTVPPPMQPIAHVLDPNVPNFTMQMGTPTPIQAEEYETVTPVPSDDYNTINNNAIMSPAANLISSPSSAASSQQNLTLTEMYLVPQQQVQQEMHLQPQPQPPQQPHPNAVLEIPQEVIIQQHEQQQPVSVDHENNYIMEQPQVTYSQPMSPPPMQHIQRQPTPPPVENSYIPEPMPTQAPMVQMQAPIQDPAMLVQIQGPPEPLQPVTPMQSVPPTPLTPAPPVTLQPIITPQFPTHVPPPQFDIPPPPLPKEFLKHDLQLQHQPQPQQSPMANDTSNNLKKKTNEVASVATPATVSDKGNLETKPVPSQSQVYVNSNKSQTSADEVARLTRAVQEKFVLKDDRRNIRWMNSTAQQSMTTIASFTSSTTTVVQHNSTTKKTTASVSVSAIPNKEYSGSLCSTVSASPSVTNAVKPYQKNTSPVPFTTLITTSAPPSMHKQPLMPQKSFNSEFVVAGPGPMMESKKVEAIPQRETRITPLPPPGPPPSLSVPPPEPPFAPSPIIVPTPYAPPPVATTAPPAMSWASLFNSSSSSSSSTSTVPTSSIIPPTGNPGPALPTPSPFAPSFIPSLQRTQSTSSSQSTSTSAAAPVNDLQAKKPIAKVLPFDKTSNNPTGTTGMSYSAASAQGLQSQSQGSTGTAASGSAAASAANKGNKNAGGGSAKPEQLDENTLKLGEFLSAYQIENNSISILPRGLINRSNYCYINAILQALVACPPFYHLMRAIRTLPASRSAKHPKPFIDAMTALMAEFTTLQLRTKVQRDKSKKDETPDIQLDTPFEPVVIHKILNLLRSDIFQVEGRQEDAEEFLGCVLNRLNDEMLELMKLSKNEAEMNGEDTANGDVHPDDQDDWKVIRGNRNKGTITRTTDFGRSPISDIFGGKLRSRVHREGDHPTDNIQPFFTLQLDIEKAASVKDALDLLVGKDQLEGVTCSKTKQEIAAWQQVTLEELPIVMILHLKCFDYKMDGCTKILKTLEFPIELKIDPKLMSSKGKSYTAKQKQYKLFAVVYHDGKEASKGHYITDVFHAGYGSWIRYDDSTVKAVAEQVVLHPKAPRVPYLLYYRRLDTHYHPGAGGSAPAAGGNASSGSSSFSGGNVGSNSGSNSGNSGYNSGGSSYSGSHYSSGSSK